MEVSFFEKSNDDDDLVLEQHLPYRSGFVVVDYDPTDDLAENTPLQFEFVEEQSLNGPGSPVLINLEELPKRERDALNKAQSPEDAGWELNPDEGYILIHGDVKITKVKLG